MRTITVVLATAFLLAVPAQAFAAIRIAEANYDSAGSDTGSNSSMNDEWVVIKNTGSKARSLNGWVLKDTAGHVYRFGSYTLAAGARVKVHTGSGDNTRRHRYWGADYYVWNNTGDKAILKNAGGSVVDTCSWGAGSGWTAC